MSDWWPEYLADAGAGIRDKSIRKQTQVFMQMLGEKLGVDGAASDELQERRRDAAYSLTSRATAIWKREVHAGRRRSRAHNAQRVAAGGGAAVAAGSGAALAVGLTGTAAKLVGIAVVFIGIVAGAVGAVWPETEYERDRDKARLYYQLWCEMWDFATRRLPYLDADTIDQEIDTFSAKIDAVG